MNVRACRLEPDDLRKALEIPAEILEGQEPLPHRPTGFGQRTLSHRSGRDTSSSGMDWAWVCNMLEAGMDPAKVQRELIATARSRRGPDTERYARRTVERAMVKVGRRFH